MPLPAEHACRLESPDKYKRIRRKNNEQKHGGKGIDVIYGVPEGKGGTEIQALRFPTEKWSASEARAVCEKRGGSFTAAKKSGDALTALDYEVIRVDAMIEKDNADRAAKTPSLGDYDYDRLFEGLSDPEQTEMMEALKSVAGGELDPDDIMLSLQPEEEDDTDAVERHHGLLRALAKTRAVNKEKFEKGEKVGYKVEGKDVSYHTFVRHTGGKPSHWTAFEGQEQPENSPQKATRKRPQEKTPTAPEEEINGRLAAGKGPGREPGRDHADKSGNVSEKMNMFLQHLIPEDDERSRILEESSEKQKAKQWYETPDAWKAIFASRARTSSLKGNVREPPKAEHQAPAPGTGRSGVLPEDNVGGTITGTQELQNTETFRTQQGQVELQELKPELGEGGGASGSLESMTTSGKKGQKKKIAPTELKGGKDASDLTQSKKAVEMKCPDCDGAGKKDGKMCDRCGGSGMVKRDASDKKLCDKCQGTGKVDGQPCDACDGTGKVPLGKDEADDAVQGALVIGGSADAPMVEEEICPICQGTGKVDDEVCATCSGKGKVSAGMSASYEGNAQGDHADGSEDKTIHDSHHWDRITSMDYLTRPFTLTPEGYLQGRAIVTNIGVFNYKDAAGNIRRELRLPEEVFAWDSIESLKLKPVVMDHPEEEVNASNVKELQVGIVGSNPGNKPNARDYDGWPESDEITDGMHLPIDMVIMDGEAVKDVQEKGKTAISCGYTCDLEPAETGAMYLGQPYDFTQRKIRYNHIALVDKARAGDAARIRLDSADVVLDSYVPRKEGFMTKRITLDGVTYEVEAGIADVMLKLHKDRQEAQGKADALKGATDPKHLDSMVAEKLRVREAAGRVQVEIKDGMSDGDVKKAVILKVTPTMKLDGKDETYINAAFDTSLETLAARADAKTRMLVSGTVGGGGKGKEAMTQRRHFDDIDNESPSLEELKEESRLARKAMIKRMTKDWHGLSEGATKGTFVNVAGAHQQANAALALQSRGDGDDSGFARD